MNVVKINFEVEIKCQYCDHTFTHNVDLNNINHHTLRRVFEDTDDGFIISGYVSCPKCKVRREVEFHKKKGWGM